LYPVLDAPDALLAEYVGADERDAPLADERDEPLTDERDAPLADERDEPLTDERDALPIDVHPNTTGADERDDCVFRVIIVKCDM
jgi:hypothetical protein